MLEVGWDGGGWAAERKRSKHERYQYIAIVAIYNIIELLLQRFSAAGLTYSNSTALNLQLEENCFMRCHTKITEAVEQNKGYDCKRQSETV